MGVPTPAPGVGTFRTPLTGASRTRQAGLGPLTSVRIRRGERSGANNPRTRSDSPAVQG